MVIDTLTCVILLLAVVLDAGLIWAWQTRRQRAGQPSPPQPALPPIARPRRPSLGIILFSAAVATFAITRLVGLENFPIYFFTDEAINTVQAANFIHHGFRDAAGQFFPTYFQNDQYVSLSVSVYLQVIPYVLFGFSEFVTRAVSVLVALSGTLAVGLILKHHFKSRWGWAGILLLSITPAWFLHSRTAFEHVVWVSFFAWFIYFYLRYRQDQPPQNAWRAVWKIAPALVAGALAFYSYNGGQLGMVVTGLLLLLVDWRYHWRIIRRSRRFALMLMILIGVLALPYVRFIATYPNETYHHLRLLNSYWTQNLSPVEKIGHLAQEYLNGLNPLYWYVPNNPIDLIRHQMKGYGNILWITLPFALIGLIVCLKQLRSAPHRTVLIALATSPLGGVLVAANVQRDLVFVIPAAILTALGLASVLQPLVTRTAYAPAAIGLCGVLCLGNFMLLADALINGPTWYDNYGLYGMQYGARQVFQTIADLRRQSPETNVWVAADWLNGPDALLQFFLPDDPHVQLFDTNDFLQARYDIDGVLFVLPSEDYQRVVNSHKFMIDDVQQTLDLPNQTTGFYFLHLEYSPQADALFAAEFEARRQLVTEPATLDGQPVIVRHTSFDFGNVANLFDGETFTLARTAGVNPAVIEIDFPTPRRLTGLTLTTGSMDIDLQVELFDAGDTPSYTYTQRYTGLPPDPTVDLNFEPHPGAVSKVRLEIRSPAAEETAHIHIREIRLR